MDLSPQTKKLELLINNYTLASKIGKNAKNSYKPNQINKQNLIKWLNIIKKICGIGRVEGLLI